MKGRYDAFRAAPAWRLMAPLALLPALLVVALAAGLTLISLGCGSSFTTTTSSPAVNKPPAGPLAGKLYVAVTGDAATTAGTGDMGLAIVDLVARKVEMVNLTDSRAPQGILFGPGTDLSPNTDGRATRQTPASLYLGNAQDGSIDQVDLAGRAITSIISPPADAHLSIGGMYVGPDGRIYMAGMADGRVYVLDNGRISATAVGGGQATVSISGICWSADGRMAYLTNMYNPADPNATGYVAVVDWPSGTLLGKIPDVAGPSPDGSPMAFQAQTTPDGRFLYVPDGADDAMVKIDLGSGQVVKRVPLDGSPRSIVFSPDGQAAYITVCHYPVENGASILVYDVAKDQVIDLVAGIPAPLAGGLVFEQD